MPPVVFDQAVRQQKRGGHGADHFTTIVAGFPLRRRGDYQVDVEALEDIPELSGIPIELVVHSSQRK
jgi:hypothetical protein